jgi:hypothetical protein
MFGSKDTKKEEKHRFKIVSEESINLTGLTVIQDRKTGVNYLMAQSMNGGISTTPILDKNGNPLVTEIEN